MPDIRLRPATQAPSDIAVAPAIDSRADVILRPTIGSDVTVAPTGRPAPTAPAAPATPTLAGAMTQAPAGMAGSLRSVGRYASALPSRTSEDDDLIVLLVMAGAI
jgi:hypothetical protein